MNVGGVLGQEETTDLVSLHVTLELRDRAIPTYPELYRQGMSNLL